MIGPCDFGPQSQTTPLAQRCSGALLTVCLPLLPTQSVPLSSVEPRTAR